jgi:hypothetical protein
MKKQSQAAIGRSLGLSPASMTKLKAMGMPVDTVEKAAEWREKNIRMSVSSPHAQIRNSCRVTPVPSAAVKTACDWMNIAAAALAGGQSIAAMVPRLRHFLAGVPVREREEVLLDSDVMDHLTADVAAVLAAEVPGADDTATMDDCESQYMGHFWYKVAAGEIQASEFCP